MKEKTSLDIEISNAEKEMYEISKILDSHKKKLQDLEYRKKKESLEPYKELAERLHAAFCQYNHTDGCGWRYENGYWDGPEHRRWLEHTQSLIEPELNRYNKNQPIKIETIEKVLTFVETIKKDNIDLLWLLKYKLHP